MLVERHELAEGLGRELLGQDRVHGMVIGDGVEHTNSTRGICSGEPGGRATRSELDPANWAPASEAQVKSVMVCPGTQPSPRFPSGIRC